MRRATSHIVEPSCALARDDVARSQRNHNVSHVSTYRSRRGEGKGWREEKRRKREYS